MVVTITPVKNGYILSVKYEMSSTTEERVFTGMWDLLDYLVSILEKKEGEADGKTNG